MFKTFISDEAGAVTVDWVVLTAALVGLGLGAINVVSTGLTAPTASLSSGISDMDPTDNRALDAFHAASDDS